MKCTKMNENEANGPNRIIKMKPIKSKFKKIYQNEPILIKIERIQ